MALAVAQVFTWISSGILVVALPRFLGDVDLGKLALAGTVVGLMNLVTEFGAGQHLTKEIARTNSRKVVASYVINATLSRIPLIVLTFVALFVSLQLFKQDRRTELAIYLMLPGLVLDTMVIGVVAALQGLQDMRPLAWADAVSKVIHCAVVAAALFMGHGLLTVAAAFSLMSLVSASIMGAYVFRRVGFARPDFRTWWPLFVGGIPFFIMSASLVIYIHIDILMLSLMTTQAAVVGWYSAALRLVQVAGFIPNVLSKTLFPMLASAAARDPKLLGPIASRGLQVALVTMVPTGFGMAVLSERIVEFLGYAPSFHNSIPLLTILSFQIPVVGINIILATVLTSIDRQRSWAVLSVMAAFLNPAMNFVLIPWTDSVYGNAAIGAAIATFLTEVFLLLGGLKAMPKGLLGWSDVWMTTRCFAAGAGMYGVVSLIREGDIFVSVVVGALSYVLLSLLLRTVRVEDVQEFYGYWKARRGGSPVAVPEEGPAAG
jgi:O-antigen/teichoic acid export membrane protein